MARKPASESAEDRAIREISDEDEVALERLALEAGAPGDSEQLSAADEDTIWSITDDMVDADHEAFATQLLTQGVPQEMLPQLLVLQEHPEWMELYARPTQDAELADRLTRLAQFPYRWSLLLDYDDPDAMVRKAESLDRRYQKKHADLQGVESTPLPAEPMGGEMPMPETPPVMPTEMPAQEQPPMMPAAPAPAPQPMMGA